MSSVTSHLERGLQLLEQGDVDAAYEEFSVAIELDPTSARAFGGRGCVWHQRRNHEKALEDYNNAIALDKAYARGYLNRGVLRLEQERIEEALADFDLASETAPEATFFFYRSRAYSMIQKLGNAMGDLNECLRLQPDNKAAYFYRGIVNSESNEPLKAIEDFSEYIRHEAKNSSAYVWRSSEFSKLKQYSDAIADLSKAIELSSGECADHYHRRGIALHHFESYEAAVSDYDRAIERDPDIADSHYFRGMALAQLHEHESAIIDYDEAIMRDSANNAIYAARGRAWKKLGEFDRAQNDLSKALNLNPNQPDILNSRGQIWLSAGELEKAITDFDEAIRQDPKHHRAHKNRGVLLWELGETEKSNESFDSAEELKLLENETEMELGNDMRKTRVATLLKEHLAADTFENIAITERKFPFRVRADLQRAIDGFFSDDIRVVHFCGVRKEHSPDGLSMTGLLESDPRFPALSVPPEYEELDIGEEEPVRCLKNGLWLLEKEKQPFAVLLAPPNRYQLEKGLTFQIATENSPNGTAATQAFFNHLENAVSKSASYRGKILSLEVQERYSGMSSGLMVHKLNPVRRDDVVLPKKTLELLDRNVIEFAKKRPQLSKMGLSTKKGILFYGPPGTGKTHTIHYLAGSMEGHTTFIITAEQVGLLSEYMVLARLLQPSIVVIEDVDLIARDRNSMDSPCEEVLLNKLLNEMDGLRPGTDVFFILTTNRPESLEQALSSRPGRIDQAIEFPLPDDDGRRTLVRLYSGALEMNSDVEELAVKKTEGVSASFIKELMRRAAQFHLEHSETKIITPKDIENALDELLFSGGSLNRKLLGVQEVEESHARNQTNSQCTDKPRYWE